MSTVAKRNRARLALLLLEGERDPTLSGVLLARVTTEIRQQAFISHQFPVQASDVLLRDGNRILIWAELENS